MNYVIDFSIVSIAHIWITAYFYRRQPKVPSTRNSLFGTLLYLGVFFAVMDVVTVLMELVAGSLPAWLVYLVNTVFLLNIQLCSALFLCYCLALTGLMKKRGRKMIPIALIPFFCVTVLLFLPLGQNGIFYLDGSNIYHRGTIYAVLYIDTAVYLLASLIAVIARRHQLRAKKLQCIFAFLGALFASMVIQYLRPELLLNATANALALTLIYHVLEAPSAHADALTGVLNKAAFPLVLADVFDQERRCTLLLFQMRSIRLVNHSLGIHAGDRLLTEFAAYLKKTFPAGQTLRVSGDIFAVVLSGGEYCGEQQLQCIVNDIPEHLHSGSMELPIEIGLACINSEDTDDSDRLLSLAEHLMRLMSRGSLGRLTLADVPFQQRLTAAAELESRMEAAVAAGNIEVFYQPIHDISGRLSALEALVRIRDGNGGFLPTQDAVEAAEKSGAIHRLGNLILRQVCQFIRDNGAADWGLHHIGVNLSALQFMRDDLCETLSSIMDEYGVPHSLVAFEITETASASIADVSRTMTRMNDAGYSFLLDDFGKGYANFHNISQLPLICVKIDKMILWEAMESDKRLAFLKGVTDMLHVMGLASVCEGVETEEQVRLLDGLGVDMKQGYHYSKPLPPDELLRYIDRGQRHAV